jgi:hypothetical protein
MFSGNVVEQTGFLQRLISFLSVYRPASSVVKAKRGYSEHPVFFGQLSSYLFF